MNGEIHAERFSVNKLIIKGGKKQERAFLLFYSYEKPSGVGMSDQQTTD